MHGDMEIWSKIRLEVLTGGLPIDCMPAGRGLNMLADVSDRQRRDHGPTEVVDRGVRCRVRRYGRRGCSGNDVGCVSSRGYAPPSDRPRGLLFPNSLMSKGPGIGEESLPCQTTSCPAARASQMEQQAFS